jgi:hypothetical protein
MKAISNYSTRLAVGIIAAFLSAHAHAQSVITSGLTFWVQADNGVQTNATGSVTNWVDQSGSGNHVRQTTAARQPSTISDGWFGEPLVRFLGSQTQHLQSVTAISGIISASEYTLFAVYRPLKITDNNEAGIFNHDAVVADSGGFFGLHLRTNGTFHTANLYNWDGNADIATTPNLLINEPQLVTGWHTNGFLFVQPYGDSVSSAASGNTTTLSGLLRLGAGFGLAASAFDGDIAEILIYNRALSSSERVQVETYLYDRWLAIPEPSAALLLLGVASLVLCRARRSC